MSKRRPAKKHAEGQTQDQRLPQRWAGEAAPKHGQQAKNETRRCGQAGWAAPTWRPATHSAGARANTGVGRCCNLRAAFGVSDARLSKSLLLFPDVFRRPVFSTLNTLLCNVVCSGKGARRRLSPVMSNNITVAVRVRPLSAKEKARKTFSCITVQECAAAHQTKRTFLTLCSRAVLPYFPFPGAVDARLMWSTRTTKWAASTTCASTRPRTSRTPLITRSIRR